MLHKQPGVRITVPNCVDKVSLRKAAKGWGDTAIQQVVEKAYWKAWDKDAIGVEIELPNGKVLLPWKSFKIEAAN